MEVSKCETVLASGGTDPPTRTGGESSLEVADSASFEKSNFDLAFLETLDRSDGAG